MNKDHVAMKHAATEKLAKLLKEKNWGTLSRCRKLAKKVLQGKF